ncbi:unnamed protein product [Effrenium voratum]|nr:unnamed protein product [Effrenium voratum]
MQRSLSWRAEAERQERQELQERLAMACCAKAWEASGLPVKRLGSAKAAVELLRVWGDLEQLGVQVITYEAVESSTSHSAGDPEGAVPEGGFSKPKTVCKIVSVVQPVEKASKPGVKE